jgi:putative DNA primase/helicase
LIDCFGAEPSPYVRKVGRWWLSSAVARVLRPGYKVDHALILEGGQGKRKSSGLRALVPNPLWFFDSDISIGDKDSYQLHAGRWILEFQELDSMARAEVTAIKKYLTGSVDVFRPSYGRSSVEIQRQCVFCGTVNESAYLRDSTGGCRFWPVKPKTVGGSGRRS